jgi:alkylhydroperoxidase family enzyme
LLFLQAAGSDFGKAHDLVDAISEAIRAPHDKHDDGDVYLNQYCSLMIDSKFGPGRPGLDPERIAERIKSAAGYTGSESLLVALAAHATIASPFSEVDVDWIASAATRIGDDDLLRETAGVIFTFNTINRIADARRVRLEYRFLRELKPIKGWVERRLASLTGLAYDLSYKYQPRRSVAEMLDRLGILFERLGASAMPDVFNWLSRSPVVLEGVLEMIEVNLTSARVHSGLLKEVVGIAVASRAMPGSGLSAAVDQCLLQASLPDSSTLRSWAAPSGDSSSSGLVSACRRYAWQVANAAYTITDEQIRKLSGFGLSDAELFDITLAAAIFSALAIIEPISAAVAPVPIAGKVDAAVELSA